MSDSMLSPYITSPHFKILIKLSEEGIVSHNVQIKGVSTVHLPHS